MRRSQNPTQSNIVSETAGDISPVSTCQWLHWSLLQVKWAVWSNQPNRCHPSLANVCRNDQQRPTCLLWDAGSLCIPTHMHVSQCYQPTLTSPLVSLNSRIHSIVGPITQMWKASIEAEIAWWFCCLIDSWAIEVERLVGCIFYTMKHHVGGLSLWSNCFEVYIDGRSQG